MEWPLMHLMIDSRQNQLLIICWYQFTGSMIIKQGGKRHQVECFRGSPCWWASHLVLQNGYLCQGKSRRKIDFHSLKHPCNSENSSYSVTFPSSQISPQWKEETLFDVWNGYHSVPLHPDNRYHTKFITLWGRYLYCTAFQGLPQWMVTQGIMKLKHHFRKD